MVFKNNPRWDDIKYKPSSLTSKKLRIGGLPSYIAEKKISQQMWPHVETILGLLPLKFLAQVELPDKRLVYLFLGVPTLEIGEDVYEPFDEFTAALVEGGEWPDWVTLKKISSITPDLLWSEKSVEPIGPFPQKPYWPHYDERVPDGFGKFLFQIGEEPGGLNGINIDMETYVFWDGLDKVVLFNENY